MPKVKFISTPELSNWVHRKGGKKETTYGDKATIKVVGPVILRSGDSIEMDDFDANWATVMYPDNFVIVGE